MWFVLPLALALAQQTYIVDDDGAGDFLDLPQAVAATAPGDLLLVAPGTYTAPTITHDLTILASAKWERPWVSGTTLVQGVGDLTLAGIHFDELDLKDLVGRGRVDDCVVQAGTRVEGCVDLVVSRSELLAPASWLSAGDPALRLDDADVVLVDCTLVGAAGEDDPISPGPGWDAITTFGDTRVHLAGTSARGGYGGCGIMGCASDGFSIYESSGAVEVVIQGSSFHAVSKFYISAGTLHWSGVSLDAAPWSWPETVPAEPYLLLGGVDLPGATRRIEAYGAVGETLLAYFCSAPDLLDLPGVLGAPLMVSPTDLFLVRTTTLMGQDTPATVSLPLPTDPTLIGFVVDVQAVVLTAAGPFLTNAHQVALRP